MLSSMFSGTCWCAKIFFIKCHYFRMNHFKRKFSNFRNKPSTPTIPERTIRIDDHTLESGRYLKFQVVQGNNQGVSGNLRNAVVLPEGESEDEWIAFNIWNFNKQINMLYGTVLSSCTMEKCPVMNAGRCYIYNWSDGKSKPKSLPGKCYRKNIKL